MLLPTADHVIFIPAVLLVGIAIGWVLGTRVARQRFEQKRARTRQ